MARMDLRVRLIGRLGRLMSITRMDDARLQRAQQQRLGHNPVIDLLFGAVADGVRLIDGTAKGAVGPVPIRVYRPDRAVAEPLPLVVNFHGGGWTLGSLDAADWLCSQVSVTTGAVVVSVDYRLAPGHRWPAAAEDCYAALVDVVDRARPRWAWTPTGSRSWATAPGGTWRRWSPSWRVTAPARRSPTRGCSTRRST